VTGADEQFAMRNRNRGAELVVSFITHRDCPDQLEFLTGPDNEHFASKVLEIYFVVSTHGR
jgi:hypothetical protein